jgi:hypothetical protein
MFADNIVKQQNNKTTKQQNNKTSKPNMSDNITIEQVNEDIIGSISEAGILGGIYKKGFTIQQCFMEIIANSIDAKSNHLTFKYDGVYIHIIDDGIGMNKYGLKRMFDIYGSNHSTDKSLGVSGLGEKAAMIILGQKTHVDVYTKTEEGDYLCAQVPWDEMYKQQKYNGMIKIRNMDENEINIFNNERSYNSGTTVKIKCNTDTKTVLESFFDYTQVNDINPLENPSIIFGKFAINISYINEQNETKQLDKYDYFQFDDQEYYCGKTSEIIKHYKKANEHKFVWEKENGIKMEIKKLGRGYAKEAVEITTSSVSDWKNIGQYNLIMGARKDTARFNEQNPCLPGAGEITHDYDDRFLGSNNGEFLSQTLLYRNDQLIGGIKPPDVKISSARGTGESMNQYYYTRSALFYYPLSALDNEQDNIMKIQENKNQYNGDSIPLNLNRLIKFIKCEKAKYIWEYFKSHTALYNVNNSSEIPSVQTRVDNIIPVDNIIQVDNIILDEIPSEIQPVNTTIVDDSNTTSDTDSNDEETVITRKLKKPTYVNGYRKGMVTGKELIEEFERLMSSINPETEYSEEEFIKLYNMMNNIIL